MRVGDENCSLCSLSQTRTNVVKNIINPDAEIAIMGIGPGENEDKEGNPFVGKAGDKLKEGLIRNNISLQDISLLNAVLCRPPGNKLKKEYTNQCIRYFEESLSLMPNLKIVMLLGVDVYKLISEKTKAAMSSIYALPFKNEKYGDIIFFPNYHPAALLYKPDPEIINRFFNGFKTMLILLESSKAVTKKHNYKAILESKFIDVVFDVIEKQKVVSFDTETTSVVPHKAKILSFHFSWEEKTGVAFPFHIVRDGELVKYWDEKTENHLIKRLKKVLTDPDKIWVAQNGKYDSLILRYNFGFDFNLKFDTMLASFLLDSNNNFSLDDIVTRELPEEAGIKTQFWSDIPEDDLRNETWFLNIAPDDLLEYGTHDADITLRIAKIFNRRLNEVV